MESTILFNRTKVVATVGPACNTKEKLEELIRAGVDVFRLNFSHGTHEGHKKVIQYVNELNEELGTHVCLLQDLQGPKIRLREMQEGTFIKEGDEFIITTEDVIGNAKMGSTTYEPLPNDVQIGDMILIDDGKIELHVTKIEGKHVHTRVVYGGEVKSRKGINLPDTRVSAPSLTEKDHEDLLFGLESGVEWVALSFVRSADDIRHIKGIIQSKGLDVRVIAKIEKPEALQNIDEIVEVADGCMVARGDLGVEIPMEDVPMAQKLIVSKCNKACKPVIIATQMMESMIENPRPTRAETNDIANAVLDGADALMLSAETASGKYPIQVVKSMTRTIMSVENKAKGVFNKFYILDAESDTFENDSVVLSACRLADETRAAAIVGMTKSGYTAFRLASHRPKANIFIFTDYKPVLKILNLVWGVRGYYYDKMESTDNTFSDIKEILKTKGHVANGDVIINTASMPIEAKLRTNVVKLTRVK